MRVLALVHRYTPAHNAGAETMLHSMLRALALRGHRVDVSLSMQSGEPYSLDGVDVWPRVGKKDVFRWLGDADVLIAHLHNTPRATFLGKMNRKPVVLVHHNTFELTNQSVTQAYSRVDLVAVNSEWMRADLHSWLAARGAPKPPTVIVRPLVDPDEYRTTPGDRVTLVNLQRTGDGPEAIGKGGEIFWRIAERMPNTKFLGVVGAYGDQEIRDLPNVEVLGHTPNHRMRDDVYARTRVLLMPSKYESWGRVAMEAMASGIPVIAHPTSGLRESLGGAGIFIDRDDIDGWVRQLSTLAMPGPWKHWSAKASTRAEQMRPDADLDRWCDAVEQTARRKALVPV